MNSGSVQNSSEARLNISWVCSLEFFYSLGILLHVYLNAPKTLCNSSYIKCNLQRTLSLFIKFIDNQTALKAQLLSSLLLYSRFMNERKLRSDNVFIEKTGF